MNARAYNKIVFQNKHAKIVQSLLPPPAPDQILVRSRYSLISPGTERAALTGAWDNQEFRQNPGYALAGEVIEIGEDARPFSIGDRVISLTNHADLANVSVHPWATLQIPENISYEEATFLPLASVALHAIRRAQITFGEILVIIGGGIIGQIALQLAKSHGAYKVLMIDLYENRLSLAREFGADVTINPTLVDPISAVMEATEGEGSPVILEAAGNPLVIPTAFKYASDGGRIICVGALEEPLTLNLHEDFIRRELSLIAAFQPYCPTEKNLYWKWTQQANRTLLLEMFANQQIRLKELLTHRFPASEAPVVYERIKAGDPSMLGVLFDWNQEKE